MPRFVVADNAYIKQRMLLRLPGCLFEEDDFDAIAAHTHLTRVQAQTWAKRIRFHYTELKREAYLRAVDNEKSIVKTSRYYTVCFGLTIEAIMGLDFKKQMRAGEAVASYEVKFIQAAVDPITTAAELYIEFTVTVSQNVVLKYLQDAGGCSFMIPEIFKNDSAGNHRAAVAVTRVVDWGKRKGQSHTVGTPTNAVAEFLKCAEAAAAAARAGDGASQAGFDAKTAEAMRQSMRDLNDQLLKVADAGEGTQNMIVALPNQVAEAVAPGIAAVGSSVGVCAGDIKLVLDTITKCAMAEQRVAELTEALRLKTKEVDRQEKKTGDKTKEINELKKLDTGRIATIAEQAHTITEQVRELAEQARELAEQQRLLRCANATIEGLRAMEWYVTACNNHKRRRMGADGAAAAATDDDEDEDDA